LQKENRAGKKKKREEQIQNIIRIRKQAGQVRQHEIAKLRNERQQEPKKNFCYDDWEGGRTKKVMGS